MGSEGVKNKHGVGILLHNQWRDQITWKATCSRVGILWMNANGVKMSIVVVYMPHRGYPDSDVDGVYNKLEIAIKEARRAGRLVLIGGDFNAEAKSSRSVSGSRAVGPYANREGNLRGEWLVAWVGYHEFCLANILLQKRWEKI